MVLPTKRLFRRRPDAEEARHADVGASERREHALEPVGRDHLGVVVKEAHELCLGQRPAAVEGGDD